MRQKRYLAPRHHGLRASRHDPEQKFGADLAGVERIVGLRAVTDNRRAVVDDILRHVGVMIEAEHDGNVIAEDGPAELDLCAFHVVDPLGRAGAVELQRQPVDGSRGFEPGSDAVGKEVEGLPRDPSACDREAANDRNGLDLETGFLDRLRDARRSARVAELFENVAALENSEAS